MATILIAVACSAAISSGPRPNEERLGTPITFTERPNIRFEGQATLFAIDDESLPRTRGIELGMVQPEKHPNNPVLARGEEGKFSFPRVTRPTVILEDGKWRMWYTVTDHDNGRMVAYAESDDGINWIKPNLGLVEFNGNMNNNLVDAQPGLAGVAVVIDPAAPPGRRYVMTGENTQYPFDGWTLNNYKSITRIDVSADGLHWTPVLDGPGIIKQQNETRTLYLFNGYYHIGGHQISPLLKLPLQEYGLGMYLGPRTFVVWRSSRPDAWPVEHTKAFYQPMRSSSPYRTGWDREDVHMGASVTPFGNVCIGIYGQWHHPINEGAPTYSGDKVSVDLGLIISNDGLHFREPAKGYTFIKRDQELTWDHEHADATKDNILLTQASLVNTDKLTHIYYSASTAGGNVGGVCANIGLATLDRDRFGYLKTIPGTADGGQVVSCPLKVDGPVEIVANVDVPKGASIKIGLMDKDGMEMITGYKPEEQRSPIVSGLDSQVRWKDKSLLPTDVTFRVRVEMQGNAKLYALYLRPKRRVSEMGSSALKVLSERGCGRATGYSRSNKIVTIGGKTHVSWLDAESPNGKFWVKIQTLDRGTGKWSAVYTVGQSLDNHGGPALTCDSSGYLHIVYYPHSDPFRYRRSVRPNDASQWTEEVQFGKGCMGPSMVCTADDKLVLVCRESSTRQWGLDLYEKPANGEWKGPRTILHGNAPSGGLHWQAALVLGRDGKTLHMSFNLEEDGLGSYGYAIGYLRSPDAGKSWQRSDGERITLPATPATIEIVDGSRTVKGPTIMGEGFRAGSIALDPDGVPWVIYCRVDRDLFEAWIARLTAEGKWRKIPLLPVIQRKWKGRGVKTPGGIVFGRDGTMYVVVTTVKTGTGDKKVWWGHQSAEVALLVSKDRGRTFNVFGVSCADDSAANWLPSLERPTRSEPIKVPGLIYTHGPLSEIAVNRRGLTEVIWCDIASLIAKAQP